MNGVASEDAGRNVASDAAESAGGESGTGCSGSSVIGADDDADVPAAGPQVPVVVDRYIRAYPPGDDGGLAAYEPLSRILEPTFASDVHFGTYSLPEVPQRLKYESLSELGVAVPIVLQIFDIDCALAHRASGGSAATPAPDAWFEAERLKLLALEKTCPGFAYRTRGGYRIVRVRNHPFTVATPSDARSWSVNYVRECVYLYREFGIVADPACKDWTRLFRAPHATRDGKPQPERWETLGDTRAVGVWTHAPREADLDADIVLAAELGARDKQWRSHAHSLLLRVANDARSKVSTALAKTTAANVKSTSVTTGAPAVTKSDMASNSSSDAASDPRGPSADVLTKASRYLAKTPAAVSGQGGHPTTFGVACALLRKFKLSEHAALGLLESVYNPRCVPPWTRAELLHKVRDAAKELSLPAHGDRPIIIVRPAEHEVVDEAVAALGKSPHVFQRGDELVHVYSGSGRRSGTLKLAPIPQPRLRELFTEQAEWLKTDKNGDLVAAHPPAWAAPAVAARASWPGVRHLEGIVTVPVLRPDGSVVETAGYDSATGVLFAPMRQFMPVPIAPTLGDAIAARQELEDILADFPFASDAHKASAICGILGPLAIHAYEGPAPLIAYDATTPGSGKGLLVDVTAQIALGAPMARMSQPQNEDEERKRILGIARSGTRAVLIDNLTRPLGSGPLDAALTSEEWSDRILGKSETVSVPLRANWYVTGNNIALAGDVARRVLIVRLEPAVERPELRTAFRHANLMAHVRTNHARLVRAALTILRAYVLAGRPNVGVGTWGSFEGWAGLVPSAVAFSGLPDAGLTRATLSVRIGADDAVLVDLVEGWYELCQSVELKGIGATAAQAIRLLSTHPQKFVRLRDAVAEASSNASSSGPTARQVGYLLRKYRGRVVNGRRIVARTQKDRACWSIEELQTAMCGFRAIVIAQIGAS